ncbi:MAG: DUF2007 domain-containing protein [Acidobacteriota bacterium]|jgi:hypothetical protein
MTDYANEEWLSIRMIDDEEEAELIEGFLKSRDIPCQLESRYSHEFPTHMGRLAEIELKVPESRAQEARELLERREGAAAADASEAES